MIGGIIVSGSSFFGDEAMRRAMEIVSSDLMLLLIAKRHGAGIGLPVQDLMKHRIKHSDYGRPDNNDITASIPLRFAGLCNGTSTKSSRITVNGVIGEQHRAFSVRSCDSISQLLRCFIARRIFDANTDVCQRGSSTRSESTCAPSIGIVENFKKDEPQFMTKTSVSKT